MPTLFFIHGWGFDAGFWHRLAPLLSHYPQEFFDFGFFNQAVMPAEAGIHGLKNAILIGHSLGLLHGVRQKQDWDGVIAINAFPRFVSAPGRQGCVSSAVVRDMRIRLQQNPAHTLAAFHALIGTQAPDGAPNRERLRAGLDELQEGDATDILAQLSCPTCVLAGEKDPLVPVAISAALDANAHIHPAGGHALPLTHPEWCAEIITAFLTEHFS